MLRVTYKSNHLSRVCTDYSEAKREYGDRMANLVHQRIDQLTASDSVELLVRFSVGRCHALTGDRKGEYAMDLVHPYRLVFKSESGSISIVRVVSIEDYH